jgi:hypothetical protein
MKNKKKFSNLNFVKKHIFLKNLILVTGTHTSGKSMISPAIASLQNVEMLRKIYYLDQISNLHFFKKISSNTAKFLGNHILDLSYYEQLIGRNMNFRVEDETSVEQSKNPNFFKKRIYINRGEKVLKKHSDLKTHMLLDAHDGIWFYNFWKNLDIKNLKIINISRNPIDIVNSWINLDFGNAEKKLLCQVPLIDNKKNIKPFYFYKHINSKKNKYNCIIDMVETCVKNEIKSYGKICKNKNIIRIDFDDFAENTQLKMKQIENFLGLKQTQFTKKILKRENLPRSIDKNTREIKINKIKKLVNNEQINRLFNLEKLYLKTKRN